MTGLPSSLLAPLVWCPAAGAAVLALLPERRAVLRRALALLFALLPLALLWVDPARELRGWAARIGFSHDLAIPTPFTRTLVAWVPWLAASAFLSAAPPHRGKRTEALVLLGESALLGLLTAGDAALWLGCYGAGLVAVTLLCGRTDVMKRWFFFQSAALSFWGVLVLLSYHWTSIQTGFPSADVSRWPTLVVDPEWDRRMLLLAAGALALTAPLLPFTTWLDDTVEALPPAGRLLLLGGWSLAGADFFTRAVAPAYVPSGVQDLHPVVVLAAIGSLYAGVRRYRGAPERSWVPLLVAFQALVVLGLLSPDPKGVAAGRTSMLNLAFALSALAIWSSDPDPDRGASSWARAARPFFIAALLSLSLPASWLVLRACWEQSPTMASIAGAGWVLLWIRLARTLPAAPRFRRISLLAPILGLWIFIVATPDRFAEGARDEPGAVEEE